MNSGRVQTPSPHRGFGPVPSAPALPAARHGPRPEFAGYRASCKGLARVRRSRQGSAKTVWGWKPGRDPRAWRVPSSPEKSLNTSLRRPQPAFSVCDVPRSSWSLPGVAAEAWAPFPAWGPPASYTKCTQSAQPLRPQTPICVTHGCARPSCSIPSAGRQRGTVHP